MKTGRIAAAAILAAAALAGGAIWYLQVYGYYRPVDPASPQALLTVTRLDGTEEALAVTGFRGIDAASSPLRFRACARLAGAAPTPATHIAVPGAEPLVTPGWFDCFDAGALAAGIAAGRIPVFLGRTNDPWGIDRLVAVTPEGQVFAWPRINACGHEVFDGKPLPEGCPPPPPRPEGG